MQRRMVDFPEPEGPMMADHFALFDSKLTPLMTSRGPKILRISSTGNHDGHTFFSRWRVRMFQRTAIVRVHQRNQCERRHVSNVDDAFSWPGGSVRPR